MLPICNTATFSGEPSVGSGARASGKSSVVPLELAFHTVTGQSELLQIVAMPGPMGLLLEPTLHRRAVIRLHGVAESLVDALHDIGTGLDQLAVVHVEEAARRRVAPRARAPWSSTSGRRSRSP